MPANGISTLTDSGKLALGANGKADVCDDCCGCVEGCVAGSTVDMTIVGVDAALCAACYKESPTSPSRDISRSNLSVDGTHNIDGFLDFGGGACSWSKTSAPNLGYDRTNHTTFDGTCSGTDSVDSFTTGILNAVYDTGNSRFSFVQVQAGTTQAFRYLQSVDGGSFDFGDTIPNGSACAAAGQPAALTLSDGGTVVINCA